MSRKLSSREVQLATAPQAAEKHNTTISRSVGTDSPMRSIAKALSWRLCSLMVTVTVAWVVTEQIAFAASIGAADGLIKVVAYYAHERTWNRFRFGRSMY